MTSINGIIYLANSRTRCKEKIMQTLLYLLILFLYILDIETLIVALFVVLLSMIASRQVTREIMHVA